MKTHRQILETVIAKGGLLGICAKQYIDDEQQATKYIIELADQCHLPNVQRSWGRRLVNSIVLFSTYHKASVEIDVPEQPEI